MGSLGGVYCVLVILVIVQRNTQGIKVNCNPPYTVCKFHSDDIIAVLFSWYSANHIDFLRRPHSRCVLLGATASFQCSVQGYVTVYWCFTRPSVAKCNLNEDFNDFNYTTNYTTTSNVTCSRLHVPARTHYNGSRFKCCFIGARRRRHCSRPASLAVSGKICMPVESFSYSKRLLSHWQEHACNNSYHSLSLWPPTQTGCLGWNLVLAEMHSEHGGWFCIHATFRPALFR